MAAPPPAADPELLVRARLMRWVRAARLLLWWEGLWPYLVPLICLGGLALAFALADVTPLLPGWLHLAGLGLVGAVGLGLMVRLLCHCRMPGMDAAARRLEQDSGLSHRPFETLADHPVSGDNDPMATALWAAHRRRVAAMVGPLRLGFPRSDMAARDPLGLRAGVLLVLVIALTVSGGDIRPRLIRALTPSVALGLPGSDEVEVWVTPPTYTGLPPLLLPSGGGDDATAPIAIPVGSTVLAVLTGGWGTARLVAGETDLPFQHQGDDSQRLEGRLTSGDTLSIRLWGMTLAQWPIAIVADATPSIAFNQAPEAGERGRLRVAVTASDDYGLTKLWVNIRRMGTGDGDDAVLRVDLPLPGTRPKQVDTVSWHDLTAHPWAGLPVNIQPEARDGAGQDGTGEAVTITLPERMFEHPAARALVEQRKLLTQSRDQADQSARVVDSISGDPDLFGGDVKVFLALRVARRLLENPDFDLAEIQDLLWNSALRIEDGDLAQAERGLEDARRALEQALEDGASTEEIRRLLDQFRDAMARYLSAMADRMAQDGESQPLGTQDGQVVTDDELMQMLDNMSDLADAGARDSVKSMLRDLSQILNGLQSPSGTQNSALADAMDQLRDVARSQQDMLTQSHQLGQGSPPQSMDQDGRQEARPSANAQANAQNALRGQLDDVAKALGQALGQPPKSLSAAGTAMESAAQALKDGDWARAAEAQSQALAALQQAGRDVRDQISQGNGGTGQLPRDPLGRPQTGAGRMNDDGTTHVPVQGELRKSRELLDEIRRRAGDRQRSEGERDYLHRLLKQF